jgi:hypothetical protein
VGKKNRDSQPTNTAIAICTAIPIDAQIQAYIQQLSYKHNQAMLCYAMLSRRQRPVQITSLTLDSRTWPGRWRIGDECTAVFLSLSSAWPLGPRTAGPRLAMTLLSEGTGQPVNSRPRAKCREECKLWKCRLHYPIAFVTHNELSTPHVFFFRFDSMKRSAKVKGKK